MYSFMKSPNAFMQPTTVICSWLPCHIWYTFFNPLGARTTFTRPVFPSSGNPLSSIFIVCLRSFSAASPPHHFPKYFLAFLNHSCIPALVTEACTVEIVCGTRFATCGWHFLNPRSQSHPGLSSVIGLLWPSFFMMAWTSIFNCFVVNGYPILIIKMMYSSKASSSAGEYHMATHANIICCNPLKSMLK